MQYVFTIPPCGHDITVPIMASLNALKRHESISRNKDATSKSTGRVIADPDLWHTRAPHLATLTAASCCKTNWHVCAAAFDSKPGGRVCRKLCQYALWCRPS